VCRVSFFETDDDDDGELIRAPESRSSVSDKSHPRAYQVCSSTSSTLGFCPIVPVSRLRVKEDDGSLHPPDLHFHPYLAQRPHSAHLCVSHGLSGRLGWRGRGGGWRGRR
jgi:hypothetical protein